VKNKLYTIVNGVGLAIAITLTLLLSIYVKTEKSIDDFHTNGSRIYRVLHNNSCSFSPPFGQYMADHISGIESYCRTFEMEAVLANAGTKIKSEACLFVDSSFFRMFSFPLINGNQNDVLREKNNVVISEGFAKQLFGNQNPIGQQIRFKNRLDFIVSGVVADFTENTHFNKPDVIFPFHTLDDVFFNGYLTQSDGRYFLSGLYVMADNNVDLSLKANELLQLVKTWYWLFQEDRNTQISFQPLKKAYFHPAKYGYPSGAREGSFSLIFLLVGIGIGLSFIALFNFINLTLAKTAERQSIIGIEKISGAGNHWIFVQSMLETFVIVCLSFSISLILFGLALPAFNQLTNYHLSYHQAVTSVFFLKSILITILVVLAAGIIPAIMVTRYKPLSSLKKTIGVFKMSGVQQSLVVLQFSISIVLIVAMAFILKQNRFMTNYNVGFNKEETLFVYLNADIKDQKQAFKNELSQIAGVQGVSLCNGMPGIGIWNWKFEYKGKPKDMDMLNVDEDYFTVMGITLKKPILQSPNSCWINESAAKSLDWSPQQPAIELEENNNKTTFVVNEVLPDMHFHSLYEPPRPTMFTKLNVGEWVSYALIRINTQKAPAILADIRSVFAKFSSNFPIEYAFLNDQINKAYDREIRTAKIVSWFALFAIIISSLGIFSLAVFALNRRTKEIGIRRVNGARTTEIMTMLNKDFLKLVAIAFLIACPIAWYAMHKWLENFAYKTDLSWWIFAAAGVLALGVALLTISWQSWRAAKRNPVESLRYE
jgi:putative ABC transport system permease protein